MTAPQTTSRKYPHQHPETDRQTHVLTKTTLHVADTCSSAENKIQIAADSVLGDSHEHMLRLAYRSSVPAPTSASRAVDYEIALIVVSRCMC